ncbi:hypothetical protein AO262_15715 [Pseudomonas fluorescens ABAC62]|nr:hypothetical protein AO262_15715 [Pseudomonas fluorescens ABAC62]
MRRLDHCFREQARSHSWIDVHLEDIGSCEAVIAGKPAPTGDRVVRMAIGLNLLAVLPSYLAARPAIQTAVFRLLPAQTTERICALERLSALG